MGMENLPGPDSGIESAPVKDPIEERHWPAKKEPPPLEIPGLSRQEESTRTSSGHSWVRLKFNVSTSGEVRQIMIIESCLKVNATDLCIDDDIHDDYAIEQIRMNRYDALGEMEEIVFIPPEY